MKKETCAQSQDSRAIIPRFRNVYDIDSFEPGSFKLYVPVALRLSGSEDLLTVVRGQIISDDTA